MADEKKKKEIPPKILVAAMVLRAQDMRLFGLVTDTATIGYCWHATGEAIQAQYVQRAEAVSWAVGNLTPETAKGKVAPKLK